MALVSSLRWLLRRAGLEIVRVRPDKPALPPDFDQYTAATIRAVEKYTMTSPERISALCEAVRYIVRSQIDGAFVECGVWRGGSMMAVARTLREHGVTDRDLYLFDTFEGMTAPTGHDVAVDGAAAETLLANRPRTEEDRVWCYAPLEGVRSALNSTGYPTERIRFVPGRVEETLPAAAPEHIALLRLDTDWYESTLHELRHLYPRLAVGGVLIIDDYGHWKGARAAVDEYLTSVGAHLLLNRIDYTGRIAVKAFDQTSPPDS